MGLYGGVAENRKVAGCGDGDQSVARLGGVTACGSAGAESDPRGAGLRREPADQTGSSPSLRGLDWRGGRSSEDKWMLNAGFRRGG